VALDTVSTVVVTGYEIWDSSDTPVRIFFHAYASPVSYSVGPGVVFRIPSGSISLAGD
jgi:hypothetical protein